MNIGSDIIEQCIAQKPSAQQKLYLAYSKMVMGVCLRYCNRANAEDLFQEVFIKVFTSIHQLREHQNIEGWIRRITVHTCLNLIKKK